MARRRRLPPGPTSLRARASASVLPTAPGTYRFRSEAGRVLYVGRAVNLRRRVQSYWGDLGDRPRLYAMVAQIGAVEAVVCDSEHEAAWLERNLLARHRPRFNRVVGGGETPCWIRLDLRPGRAGLSVVYVLEPPVDDVLLVGPYLGTTRTRRAVAALDRAYAVRYAEERLSASERDMGRIRGVALGDRERLAGQITAVLARDPKALSAVQERLLQLRDAASGKLAFETAARIQEETEGLHWATSVQRVTTSTPGEVVVHGWHDGLLVRFGLRDGVLDSWSVRAAGAVTGARRTGETPPQWTEFADRNARLAAALAAAASPAPAG